MFDTLDRNPEFMQLIGRDFAPQSLAVMHGAWASFVKTGTPRHAGLPEWPAYDPARPATMHLDVDSHIVLDPDGESRQLWSNTDY